MSSMMKSMSRESRCRMERICRAPSEGRGAAGAVAGGLVAARRARPRVARASSGREPRNKMEKKLLMASQMRPKDCSSPSGYNHGPARSRERVPGYYTDWGCPGERICPLDNPAGGVGGAGRRHRVRLLPDSAGEQLDGRSHA